MRCCGRLESGVRSSGVLSLCCPFSSPSSPSMNRMAIDFILFTTGKLSFPDLNVDCCWQNPCRVWNLACVCSHLALQEPPRLPLRAAPLRAVLIRADGAQILTAAGGREFELGAMAGEHAASWTVCPPPTTASTTTTTDHQDDCYHCSTIGDILIVVHLRVGYVGWSVRLRKLHEYTQTRTVPLVLELVAAIDGFWSVARKGLRTTQLADDPLPLHARVSLTGNCCSHHVACFLRSLACPLCSLS